MGSSILGSILGWLRQGYAEGIPARDYVPLLEVLHRRLTDEEVDELVRVIVETDDLPVSAADIEKAAQERLLLTPDEADLARVASRLAAGGWPLSDLPRDASPSAS